MKSMTSQLLFFCLLGLVLGCQQDNTPAPEKEVLLDCTKEPALCHLAAINNQFGLNAFRKLETADPGKNLFISPLSISTALTMTMNGADQQTLTEMGKTLGIDAQKLTEVNVTYRKMLENYPSLDTDVELSLANSIWYRQGFPVLPAFLDVNREYFKSEVQALDFKRPDAKDVINSWVNQKTKGLIPTIVDQIPDNAVMYLLNAIYFKGSWLHEFDTKKTTKGIFNAANSQQVTTDFMTYGQIKLPYYATDKFQSVDLAYGDSIFSMSILLPKEGYSVKDILPQLSADNWEKWSKQYVYQDLFFTMPKFSITYEKTLNQVLAELGMPTAFIGGQANFSKIASNQELFINQVKHKAFVQVDERGTEAAAVTSVEIGVTSIPTIPTFMANKPFLFIIRENQTNSMLFLGILNDPSNK